MMRTLLKLAIEHGKPLAIRVMMHFYGDQPRGERRFIQVRVAAAIGRAVVEQCV